MGREDQEVNPFILGTSLSKGMGGLENLEKSGYISISLLQCPPSS